MRFLTIAVLSTAAAAAAQRPVTQGALLIKDASGQARLECPLKHTDVKAEISGFLNRVTVTQEFRNTAPDKIEAVYVFPLPHEAAVDRMTMHIGSRVVKGTIKRRAEARAIYEAARNTGRAAALLDQERPNIFTQSVANIPPGETVRIEISYVERLPYEAGTYEFVFPMVVGPRYNPASVNDARSISPPVARPETRAGHDISIAVKLDAGLPIDWIASPSHEAVIDRPAASRATVRLRSGQTIPNKDFILRYDVAGGRIQDTILTYRNGNNGYFSLILQPPDKVTVRDLTPKEIVFVLDTSGSMSGFPIEKAKEAMDLALAGLNPFDTFNLITFAGDTHVLFPAPVPANPENLARAREFLRLRQGQGGTEMMKAIRAALASSGSQKHIRIVCFMTDGYVGNEAEILSEIRLHQNARIFSFGIGNSVNRYLLDKMAYAGRGEVEYVSLRDDGSAAAKRFHERVRNPLLTDITVEWNGLPVSEVLPARIPDLFSAKPVVISGRYGGPAKGTVVVKGKLAGSPWQKAVAVDLPASAPAHDTIATLWARTKIDALTGDPGTEEAITQLGLDYKLMTQFTSFVAVEETVINEGGQPRRVDVPVEIPDGVSYDGIFGANEMAMAAPMMQFSSAAVGNTAGVFRSARPQAMKAELRDWHKPEKIDPALKGKTGVLRIQILLTNTDAATLAALKQLGFELTAKPTVSRLVIGRISAEKLEALAKHPAVSWISPAAIR